MSLQNRIDNLGAVFGGYAELSQILPIADLRKIASFPGNIFVTSAASLISPDEDLDDINLLDIGYIANTPYSIFNSNLRFLYTSSTPNWLGLNEQDKQLAYAASHASYYYIYYKTLQGYNTALIWLRTRLNKEDSRLLIKSIESNARVLQQSQARQLLSELFIYSPIYSEKITLYIASGQLQTEPSIASILRASQTNAIEFQSKSGKLFKNLEDNWIIATSLELNPDGTLNKLLIWPLGRTMGSGTERIFTRKKGLAYISANGLNRISLTEPEQLYSISSLIAQVELQTSAYFLTNASLLELGITITPGTDQYPSKITIDPNVNPLSTEYTSIEVWANEQEEQEVTVTQALANQSSIYTNSANAGANLINAYDSQYNTHTPSLVSFNDPNSNISANSNLANNAKLDGQSTSQVVDHKP